MAILAEAQRKEGYFQVVGGFPTGKIVKEAKDYTGENRLCIACTQLDGQSYDERARKRILAEWIDFFQTDTKLIEALHFNSRVPQALLDAACCQENLEELRFKWGPYSDLSALENLKKLRFLYIGSGAGVRDISVLGKMKNLIVLYVENFKRIEDYSPLTALDQLEQLVISGPMFGRTPVKDMEFLRDMKSLVSVGLLNTTIRKKYSFAELASLRAALPDLYAMYDCIRGFEKRI